MAKEVDAIKRTRIWVRIFWPSFLIVRFTVYAFVDDPPHFLFWHSSRTLHATFYVIAACLVIVTLGQTDRRILEWKALVIWFIAFTSFMSDLLLHNENQSQRWNSAISWLGLIIANQMVIRLRISVLDDEGRG